ncbi:unnamed protein product [Chrysodeixis includens]|uniref:Large ribosomal subunit protein eL24 n=1 Tax=Chrysodeixis includens TaxID=689277 RepID=A0A9P0BZZ7_CHRIL|nr:unnamed protein product [Chrysodeixis includens]
MAEIIDRSRSQARIKLSNVLMLMTALASFGAILVGKNAAKRGESVHQMNLDWHKKYEEEYKEKEAAGAISKIGLCAYSGYKIYPGHGKTMVKVDGKSFTFLNSKCEAAHLMRRNPRKVTWTVLYRRKFKKGQEEEQAKKRTRRTQKFQRAIVGASLSDIMAKRNMKPEVRKAQREQAIKAAKEQKKSTKAAKKAAAPAPKAKTAPKAKAAKVSQKSAPRVGGKR